MVNFAWVLLLVSAHAATPSLEKTSGYVQMLARQLIMKQNDIEQGIRSKGGSGLTSARAYNGGSRSFHHATHTNGAAASAHDHSNNRYTVGMGELAAVLNGVEFWTRHNDYSIRTPAKSNRYHATEYIKHPPVPPAVLEKSSVSEQVAEMKLWFKAWQDQDHSVRDYRPYFYPVLSYLEGAWIKDHGELKEPFQSDRHSFDAKTWQGLHDKSRFLLANGRKNNAENLAYLPTTVRDMGGDNNDVPETANFEYRIAAIKLDRDVPLNRLRVTKDLMAQMMNFPKAQTQASMQDSRKARYTLNPKDSDTWFEGPIGREFVDDLMEQVPGKDNKNANLTDYVMGEQVVSYTDGELMNVGYYSRFYAVRGADASGRTRRKRGFNDPSMWSAMTTQPKVSSLRMNDGYGELKCGLSDECIAEITSHLSWSIESRAAGHMAEMRDLSDDQLWQRAGFIVSNRHVWEDKCVEAGNCKCPQSKSGEAEVDWKTSVDYHSDDQLMCRWKVAQDFYHKNKDSPTVWKNEGKVPQPTPKDPSCGPAHPPIKPGASGAGRGADIEWKKCPREPTEQKWTWAIPLEIIYLNPLANWNPYKIPKVPNSELGGRNGDTSNPSMAYLGVDGTHHYTTPASFYGTNDFEGDPADTVRGGVGILDGDGNVQKCFASGIWIHMPSIPGVTPFNGAGRIRQRYPIYPIHEEGNTAWKELKAFEAVQLTGDNSLTTRVREEALGVRFEMTFAAGHVHTIDIDGHTLVTKLKNAGDEYVATSTLQNGHEHQVTVRRLADGKFEMVKMEPPEPHRLVVVSGVSTTKDSEVKKDGELDESPETKEDAASSVETKKQFDAVYKLMNKMREEITSLKSQLGEKGSCGQLSEVKGLLCKMSPEGCATPTPEPESEPESEPEPEPETSGNWKCSVCSHVYDADTDGAGKTFESLPSDWKCPKCGAAKSAYKKVTRRLGEAVWEH